ncbi:hypothetical protein TorRG33x02_357640 [Trema orientale]|uniref:Uncharacterized protein n=1 Tax=Trema orientale TaxID=63057 RepID=A0A2P5A4N9_TREOI|nr:hypothetical protein TorRG33x02_357640 [Trema orientale]
MYRTHDEVLVGYTGPDLGLRFQVQVQGGCRHRSPLPKSLRHDGRCHHLRDDGLRAPEHSSDRDGDWVAKLKRQRHRGRRQPRLRGGGALHQGLRYLNSGAVMPLRKGGVAEALHI